MGKKDVLLHEGAKRLECLKYCMSAAKLLDFLCDIPLINQDVIHVPKSNSTICHTTSFHSFSTSHLSISDPQVKNFYDARRNHYLTSMATHLFQ